MELRNLPFQVTRYGKVVATIIKDEDDLVVKVVTTTLKGDKNCEISEKGSHNSKKVITAKKRPWTNPLTDTALAPKE